MADVSFIGYFVPLLAYLLVAFVVGALLIKFELLGKGKWVAALVALVIASLFVSFGGSVKLISTLAPWFAVWVVCLFFILFLIAFVGEDADFIKKGVGVTFILSLIIVFLVTAFGIYSSVISPFLPGDGSISGFTDWLYSSRVAGAIALIVVSALVAWVLVKVK
jgi:hypothetical protein